MVSSHRLQSWLLPLCILLLGCLAYSYRQFRQEHDAHLVYQQLFEKSVGLSEGFKERPPVLMVSGRRYNERRLYSIRKGDMFCYDCMGLLESAIVRWPRHPDYVRRYDSDKMPVAERRQILKSSIDVLLAQCRLFGEDQASLRNAINLVITRYSHPVHSPEAPEDLAKAERLRNLVPESLPLRVDLAYYNGVRCWIVTCLGTPLPSACSHDEDHEEFFSIPVSLDGRDLVPKWRVSKEEWRGYIRPR